MDCEPMAHFVRLWIYTTKWIVPRNYI